MNTLDNARENEIRLQLYQSYKQDRIYRCGEFDHMSFHIRVTYCGTSVRSVVEKTKSSKKERRLKIRTHAKLLQRNWNANCNTSDQGVISHSRATKKTNFCILLKLKTTISLMFELLEKMMLMMNPKANFFLAALLFMRLLRMFFKLQADFTDAGRRQIHHLKERSPFYLAMTTIFYWRRQFPEYQTFLNFFLNN